MLTRSAEEQRTRLRSVAYRLLGTYEEADEALRAAAERARSTGAEAAEADRDTLARVCLERLHLRETRRGLPPSEEADRPDMSPALEPHRTDAPEPPRTDRAEATEEIEEAALDALPPSERLAFVLHDVFAVSYEEIAPIVGRTPAAARHLVARARRRVEDTEEMPEPDVLDGRRDRRPRQG
ncbi:sigma factor-like helix-turn-helix DNA-binding protein [Streptomyces sp. NPDC126499]|uniref:sigma factor-like helix-turn-helix DNA-binding protein n=1 Tax=Streptomyces sp. NPDC126499 TaxID=3155314 RepID=UPI00332FC2B4